MDPVDGAEEDQAKKSPEDEAQSGPAEVPKEQEGFFNLLSHVQGARGWMSSDAASKLCTAKWIQMQKIALQSPLLLK
ncbi:unnamed protein product [Staurois parvus]|uniref:Uncharacterized protein n=1 Tax=Staurois parvus TaxID=386267 RepID=A0ABN9CJ06_9NEOB|nr:unnamed protein product [Staurois parvus]